MVLEEKISAVEALFKSLDAAINQFQTQTSLHCKWGCGKCCYKPDIEATILEFLPFALHLYRENKIDDWYARMNGTESPTCQILNPTSLGAGLCSEYIHRGLICRLFGYSARTNKYSMKELVTCSIIKTEQATAFQKAEKEIDQNPAVPVMSNYYMQLHAIDGELSREFYPINEAIKKAIERVLHHFSYGR